MTSLCSKRWSATDVALLTARGSTGAQGFYKGVSLVEKASAFGSTSAGVRARTGSLKRFDLFFCENRGSVAFAAAGQNAAPAPLGALTRA